MPEKPLQDVMAISSGNSLYMAGYLLADPAETLPSDTVQKIPGNIGRPGIALLIPPKRLKIPKVEPGNWRMIEHAASDGARPIGQFGGVSVYISSTGYELAVGVEHGMRGR